MDKKIVGVFYTEHEASQAIEDLKSQGFLTEDISVIARNKDDVKAIREETGTKAPEGMASGAATGGLLGGVTGLLAGIGALAIPGIGPIVAAGPIAATLAGAVVGAGTGGLVGGLIGLGFPEDEAKSYEKYVDEGNILVMVEADSTEASKVYSVFRSHNSSNSDRYIDNSNVPAEVTDSTSSSVTDMEDAVLHGTGVEGRQDTGLDTMNSAPVHNVPETRTPNDVNREGNVLKDEDEARRMRLREEPLDTSNNKW